MLIGLIDEHLVDPSRLDAFIRDAARGEYVLWIDNFSFELSDMCLSDFRVVLSPDLAKLRHPSSELRKPCHWASTSHPFAVVPTMHSFGTVCLNALVVGKTEETLCF